MSFPMYSTNGKTVSSAVQVEQWILQSSNPADSAAQWQATNALQAWMNNSNNHSNGLVPSTLFQLLQQSQHVQVQFYALTELSRVPLDATARAQLRVYLITGLSSWQQQPVFVRNKAAMILSNHILQDVPDPWLTVGDDLVGLYQRNPLLFLKTVETLLEDFAVTRVQDEAQYSSEITSAASRESVRRVKDALKGAGLNGQQQNSSITFLEQWLDCVVSLLVESLQQSTNGHSSSSVSSREHVAQVQELSLQTIKGFFMWTELCFVATDEKERTVLELCMKCLELHRPASTQLAALQAWQEYILSSDQVTASSIQNAKFPVFQQLLERLHEYNLLPYTGESTAEIEVVIEVAKLVNTMGLEVLPVWESCYSKCVEDIQRSQLNDRQKNSQQVAVVLETLFREILDLFFRAFAYDDIDVSAAVIPLASALCAVMEEQVQEQQSTAANAASVTADGKDKRVLLRQQLPHLLNTLYRQLKYPADFTFDHEDEDEAEEEVYRTQLCKLYTKLVRAAPGVCLQFVAEAVSVQLTPNSSSNNNSNDNNGNSNSTLSTTWPDLQATLRLTYHYCEGIRPPPGLKVVMRNESFVQMLTALHKSNVNQHHSHPQVLLQYYEVAVRYYPIFQQEGNSYLLQAVLAALTGSQGLLHPSAVVRSRCCYLLLRLVKQVVSLLSAAVETAVSGIQGLLNSNAQSPQPLLRSDDTLYLFETVGLLLGKTGLDPASQQRYLADVITPHVKSIEQVLGLGPSNLARDAEHYGEILSHSIAAMAHLSKGFKKPAELVQLVLLETLNITCRVLEALPTSDMVRSKSMVLLQRMIFCIGFKVLPKIPGMLYLLIEHCTEEDVLFVAQVLNQLCIKFKEEAVAVIDGALLPFLQKCQSLMPTRADVASGGGNENFAIPPHLSTEQLSIQKLAFVVLQHVVTHNASAVLVSPVNAPHLEMVLQTVKVGACTAPDPVVRKTCVRFFHDLIQYWGGETRDVAIIYRTGFMTFCGQVLVPSMVESLVDPSFDERDAMSARVVSEFAACLLAILQQSPKNNPQQQQPSSCGQTALASLQGRVPQDLLEALQQRVATEKMCTKDVEVWLGEVIKVSKRGGVPA